MRTLEILQFVGSEISMVDDGSEVASIGLVADLPLAYAYGPPSNMTIFLHSYFAVDVY